jgi:hypothetical protein
LASLPSGQANFSKAFGRGEVAGYADGADSPDDSEDDQGDQDDQGDLDDQGDDDLDPPWISDYIEQRLKELEVADALAEETAALALEGALTVLIAERAAFAKAVRRLIG